MSAADLTRTELAEKIATEVKAADDARTEMVNHSRAAGELLIEAARRFKGKNFDAFLKDAGGLGRSRAYELMAVARGRKTIEQIQSATRERVRKHRKKTKLLPPSSPPLLPPLSVTVTDNPDPETEPTPEPKAESEIIQFDAATSKRALAEFKVACQTWLPRMTGEDLAVAIEYVASWKKKTKRAS